MRSLAEVSPGERHLPLSVFCESGGALAATSSGTRLPLPRRRSSRRGNKACSRASSALGPVQPPILPDAHASCTSVL
eukprot:11413089-Alexandrium_andersonii.AAC.1